MANLFRASEIVELGIQIEQNGREFYLAAAKASKDPQARQIFDFLAGEELRHEKVFQTMLKTVEKYKPEEAYSEDYYAYLKALSEEHVFTRKDEGKLAAERVQSDMQAIDMAITFEKDSILLFHEMKQLVSEQENNTVDKLIQQEQEHLLKLKQLKNELKDTRGYHA